ncbi:MAG TPA: exonuclease SbcCD subunit D [Thermodesulfobacteriota bacterium]|nr:exonuclease SbcCD subunit D [Thermodesulfobacteriota bacterium]
MGITFLHTADLHFGMENYGRVDPATGMNRRLVDFREAFSRALDYALERDVDLVLIVGDCFKSRDPSATHQREFAACLRKVLERRIPVVVVLGNHDTPNAFGRAHALAVYGSLGVPRLVLFERPDVKVVETFHGPLQIAALPYASRAFLLEKEAYKGRSLEEVNRLVAEKCASIIEGLAERADPSLPTVFAYHGSVGGAIFGSERSVMLGHDLVLPYSAVELRRPDGQPVWDYVALGHLHRHQDLNPGRHPPVVYPGSIERIDFGEEREEKGVCWVEVERGRARYEFLPLPARPFVTLRLDCTAAGAEPLPALEAALAAREPGSLREAVVRVIVAVAPGGERFDEAPLRARLAREGVYYLAGIVREVRGEAPRGRDSQLTERLTPLAAIERYLAAAPEFAPRRERLLAAARELIQALGEGEGR